MPPSHPAAPARRALVPYAVPAALALLHLALALGAYNPTPYVGGDNATYLALAHSLLERGHLVELWDPSQRPQGLYPPVFPALLALGMLAGLRTYVTLKYVVIAFSTLGVMASYLWMRRAGGLRPALAGGLWMALAPGIVELSHWELSDVPFWAFTAFALWAFAHVGWRRAGDAEARRRTLAWVAAGAAATATADMTRSAGLPLMLAAAVWLVLRRDAWGLLVYGVIVWVPSHLWSATRQQAAGTGGQTPVFPWAIDPYRPEYGNVGWLAFGRRIVDNTAQYAAHHLPTLLLGSDTGRLAAVVGTGAGILAVAGWARRLRAPGVTEVWLPVYVGLILAWPQNWSGERLLLPVLPAMLLYALQSAAALARAARARLSTPRAGSARRWPAWAPAAAACAGIVLLAAPGDARQVRHGRQCTAEFRAGERFPCLPGVWRDYLALGHRARGRLPRGSVVIARKPTLWYMVSGYPSRVYPFSAQPDTFFRAARQAGARYVVDDHFIDLAPIYLHPILRARPGDFCEVPGMALPGARLLLISPTAGTGPPADTAARGEDAILPCGQAQRARRGRLRIGPVAPAVPTRERISLNKRSTRRES